MSRKSALQWSSEDAYNDLQRWMKENGRDISSLFILVDGNTHGHCLPLLLDKTAVFEEAEVIEIPAGEENKNLDIAAQVWMVLEERGADRHSFIVNLGGGMITDLGGFVASAFRRGIKFGHIPTSLLAMVDAAIGGKNAVNLNHLKNVAGYFQQPEWILTDRGFLETLDQRQVRNGYAELVKHALLEGGEFFAEVMDLEDLTTPPPAEMLKGAAAFKSAVVERDFRESGERKKLNFGHTLGHAIESLAMEKGEDVLHGEAIAAGMICELGISIELAGMEGKEGNRISAFLARHFPVLKTGTAGALWERMLHDKKSREGKVEMSLLRSPGDSVQKTVEEREAVARSLEYYERWTRE